MRQLLKYDIKNILWYTPFISVMTALLLFVFSSIPVMTNLRNSSFIGTYYLSSFIVNGSTLYMLNAFLLLLPLACSLYIGKYMIDESHIRITLFSKISKKKYLFSKIIVSFVSGFLMCMIVLMLSVVFMMILVPEDIDLCYTTMALSPYGSRFNDYVLFSNLYINNPMIYLFISMTIISLFAGIYSLMTMLISLFIKNKVIVYSSCFLFVALSNFFIIIPSINQAMMPSIHSVVGPLYSVIILGVYYFIFIISIIVLSIKYLKGDVY